MGMGFENCEVGFGKRMNWEMGLVSPPTTKQKKKTQKFLKKL